MLEIEEANNTCQIDYLTNREQQVYDLLVTGYGYSDVAKKLTLQQSTVATFVQQIYEKHKLPINTLSMLTYIHWRDKLKTIANELDDLQEEVHEYTCIDEDENGRSILVMDLLSEDGIQTLSKIQNKIEKEIDNEN